MTKMKMMALLSIGEDGNDWESQCCVSVSQSDLFHFAFPYQGLHTMSLQLWSCYPPDWKQPHVDVSTWGNTMWQWEGTDLLILKHQEDFQSTVQSEKKPDKKSCVSCDPTYMRFWKWQNYKNSRSAFARGWRWEGRRQWYPTPVLLPGKSHGRRNLVGCSPWGRQESDTTEQLHFHFLLSCIGEGNGNSLQYSCLENPRDGGAWWAAIYGVIQSQTRLKWLSSRSRREEVLNLGLQLISDILRV